MILTKAMIMIMVMIMMMSMSMTMIMVSLISYHCQHRLWLSVSQAVCQYVSSVSVSCTFTKKHCYIYLWSWLARVQVYSSNDIFRRHCGSSTPTHGYLVLAFRSMNAAELQRLYAAELARPPFSDAQTWYQLRKILKDNGITISQQAAITWRKSHRQAP